MIEEPIINFMNGFSPTLIVIGVFSLSIGIFVTGIKFMFWSFDNLKKYIIKREDEIRRR